jgi:hypothetical protein
VSQFSAAGSGLRMAQRTLSLEVASRFECSIQRAMKRRMSRARQIDFRFSRGDADAAQ